MSRERNSYLEERERIMGSPSLLVFHAKKHFYGENDSLPIQIEIELENSKEKLILMSKLFYLGDPLQGYHEYNETGTAFYRDLSKKFQSVLVQLAYSDIKYFPNFATFVAEIM
jgi:hypothetical protein